MRYSPIERMKKFAVLLQQSCLLSKMNFEQCIMAFQSTFHLKKWL